MSFYKIILQVQSFRNTSKLIGKLLVEDWKMLYFGKGAVISSMESSKTNSGGGKCNTQQPQPVETETSLLVVPHPLFTTK